MRLLPSLPFLLASLHLTALAETPAPAPSPPSSLTITPSQVATATLPPDARIAIIGDSITEQKLYSKFLEAYLLACTGRQDITCFQFGWGGETAGGFLQRLENDLSVFRPTVATTCYGMNDGGYQAFKPEIGAGYEKNMRALVGKLQAIGVKTIVVGTPGAVDTTYYKKGDATSAQIYNQSLAQLGAIGRKIAGEQNLGFADVHGLMMKSMIRAKVGWGEEYDVGGRDGVHPGPNGHLLMAEAFLTALNLDGNIGEITLDMKGSSVVGKGHSATGTNGSAEIESTTWPFCFEGDDKSPQGTRSILGFTNFNEKLNRLTLRVKNLEAARATVTWGAESKEFSQEQLARGINLAAEFAKTPFDADFAKFMAGIAAKQNLETQIIKGMITNFRSFADEAKTDAELASAMEVLKRKLLSKQEALDAAARKLLGVVKHRIQVQ